MSEMEKYICKSSRDKIMIVGAGLLFTVVGVAVLVTKKELFALIPLVMGVLVLYGGLTAGSSDRKALQKLEDEGALSKAEADFANAVQVAGDRARIGQEFIFRRKYAVVLRCRDVKKLYYTEGSSTDSDRPTLVGNVYLKMENGREEKLFEREGGAEEDAILAAQLLMERNPELEVHFPESHGLIDGAVNLFKKMSKKNTEV